MPDAVDIKNVSPVGLETSPVAEALAGLRANEARYLKNTYDHDFVVSTPEEDPATLAWIEEILRSERDIVIASPALEVSGFEAGGIRFAYVFYQSGLSINVMYTIADAKMRPWDSSSPWEWTFLTSWPGPSSSRGSARSWRVRSEARTSRSRASTEDSPRSPGQPAFMRAFLTLFARTRSWTNGVLAVGDRRARVQGLWATTKIRRNGRAVR